MLLIQSALISRNNRMSFLFGFANQIKLIVLNAFWIVVAPWGLDLILFVNNVE